MPRLVSMLRLVKVLSFVLSRRIAAERDEIEQFVTLTCSLPTMAKPSSPVSMVQLEMRTCLHCMQSMPSLLGILGLFKI